MSNQMDELKAFANAGETKPNKEKKAKKDKKAKKNKEPKAPKEKKEPKPKRDNIAHVNGLGSIAEVRRFLQIAVAKKTKSAGRPDSIARYEKEIEAAKAKLEGLLAEANGSGDPVQTLIDLGEEPNRILTSFIIDREQEFKDWAEENEYKVTRTTLTKITDEIPQIFLNMVPVDLHSILVERQEKNDYRFKAICKKFNFIKAVMDGTIVRHKNRWLTPDELKAKEEAEAEKARIKAEKDAEKEAKKAAKAAEKEAAKAAKKAEKEAAKEAAKEAKSEEAAELPA